MRNQGDRPRQSDTVVVALEDEALLEGLADLRWRLGDLLAGGESTLVIDVSGVEKLSSATVAAMLWAKRRCTARRVNLVVRRPTHRSMQVLRQAGLMPGLEVESGHLNERARPAGGVSR